MVEWEELQENFVNGLMETYGLSRREAEKFLPNHTYLTEARAFAAEITEQMQKYEESKPTKISEIENLYFNSLIFLKYVPALKENEASELGYESREEMIRSFLEFYRELRQDYPSIRAKNSVIPEKLVENLYNNPATYLEVGEGFIAYRDALEKEREQEKLI